MRRRLRRDPAAGAGCGPAGAGPAFPGRRRPELPAPGDAFERGTLRTADTFRMTPSPPPPWPLLSGGRGGMRVPVCFLLGGGGGHV